MDMKSQHSLSTEKLAAVQSQYNELIDKYQQSERLNQQQAEKIQLLQLNLLNFGNDVKSCKLTDFQSILEQKNEVIVQLQNQQAQYQQVNKTYQQQAEKDADHIKKLHNQLVIAKATEASLMKMFEQVDDAQSQVMRQQSALIQFNEQKMQKLDQRIIEIQKSSEAQLKEML